MSTNQLPMPGKHRRRSRIAFTPFSACPCCSGATSFGRAQEKRQWRAEIDEEEDVD